jgi:hypothetical protein
LASRLLAVKGFDVTQEVHTFDFLLLLYWIPQSEYWTFFPSF